MAKKLELCPQNGPTPLGVVGWRVSGERRYFPRPQWTIPKRAAQATALNLRSSCQHATSTNCALLVAPHFAPGGFEGRRKVTFERHLEHQHWSGPVFLPDFRK